MLCIIIKLKKIDLYWFYNHYYYTSFIIINPFSFHIDVDHLLNRIYWPLLVRAKPLECTNLLKRSIVIPLTHTLSIHSWLLLPQATWDDVITFIHSSLTSDELRLLTHDCLIPRL